MLFVCFVIIVVGVGLALVNKHVEMQPSVKTLLNVFVLVALGLWLLRIVGVSDIPIPRVR